MTNVSDDPLTDAVFTVRRELRTIIAADTGSPSVLVALDIAKAELTKSIAVIDALLALHQAVKAAA